MRQDIFLIIKIQSFKDYADLVASTRETVTVTLNRLRRKGVIDLKTNTS